MSILTRAIVEVCIQEARKNILRPNLSEQDLSGLDLSRLDLRCADLKGSNLRGTDLWRTDLRDADLQGANLWDADLRRTNLRCADLKGSNLRGTDLWRTDLQGADLQGANLRGTDLRCADLRGTYWDGLVIDHLPSGHVYLIPTPDGWYMRVSCWDGTPDELRHLIAQDEGWPEAEGEEIARRRPYLEAALTLCEVHMADHADVIDELRETWGSTDEEAA